MHAIQYPASEGARPIGLVHAKVNRPQLAGYWPSKEGVCHECSLVSQLTSQRLPRAFGGQHESVQSILHAPYMGGVREVAHSLG